MSVVPEVKSNTRRRDVVSVALVLAGAAGFAFALSSLYLAMSDVMVTNGGQCASGGPYTIADGHQCSGSTVGMTLGGIFGMLAAAVVLMVGSARMAGSRAGDLGLLMWAALFGALGWNFLRLGFAPPDDAGLQWGWIVPGAVFWLMAAPALIGLPSVLGLRSPTQGGVLAVMGVSGPPANGTRAWTTTLLIGVAAGIVLAAVAY